MVWNNEDPYSMWTEETPPGSQSPSSPNSVEDPSESLKGLDWRDAIDDSMEDLEFRRSATINDHSYANPITQQEPKFTRDMISRRSNAIQGKLSFTFSL